MICCNVIQFGSAPTSTYATIFCRNAATGRLVWYQLGERRPIIGSSFGWNLRVVFSFSTFSVLVSHGISVFSFFHSSFALEDIKTEATTFMDEAVCNHKLRHSPGFFFLDCFVEFCNIFLGSSHEGFKACCFEVSKVSLQSLESFTRICWTCSIISLPYILQMVRPVKTKTQDPWIAVSIRLKPWHRSSFPPPDPHQEPNRRWSERCHGSATCRSFHHWRVCVRLQTVEELKKRFENETGLFFIFFL